MISCYFLCFLLVFSGVLRNSPFLSKGPFSTGSMRFDKAVDLAFFTKCLTKMLISTDSYVALEI
jgi:hypothetical protein